MNVFRQAAALALLMPLCFSCATSRLRLPSAVPAETAVFTQWGEENALQNAALGQREIPTDVNVVFSALVVGLAERGFAVKNLDRQAGYIHAQGPSALRADEERVLAVAMTRHLNMVSSEKWEARPGNAQLSVTVWLRPTSEHSTFVKMTVANVDIDGVYARKYYALYPPRLAAEFASVWASVDREMALRLLVKPTNTCTSASVY